MSARFLFLYTIFSVAIFIIGVSFVFAQQDEVEERVFNYSFADGLPSDLVYWACGDSNCQETRKEFETTTEGEDTVLVGDNHNFIRFNGNDFNDGPFIPKSFSLKFKIYLGSVHLNFGETLEGEHIRHFLVINQDAPLDLISQNGEEFKIVDSKKLSTDLGVWHTIDINWNKDGLINIFLDSEPIFNLVSPSLVPNALSNVVSFEILPDTVAFFENWTITANLGEKTPIQQAESLLIEKAKEKGIPIPAEEFCLKKEHESSCLEIAKESLLELKKLAKEFPEVRPLVLEVSSFITARSIQNVFSSDSETRGEALKTIVSIAPQIVVEATKVAIKKTGEFVDSPAGKTTIVVTQPIGVVSGGVAIGSQVVLSTVTVTSFSDIYLLIVRAFGIILGFFGKKKKEWGTVYDSVTKRPLDPAFVVIKEEDKEVTDAITDLDGRYGFLLNPGKYLMEAQKTNYAFPSKKLSGQSSDILYDNLYFGQNFETTEGEVVTKNIPLDQINFDWNEFQKDKQKLFRLYSRKEKIWRIILRVFYSAGFLATLLATVFDPRPLNYLFLGIYLLFMAYQYFLLPSKKAVSLKYTDGEPIPFSIVRAFSAKLDKEVKKVVTDKLGRFYMLVAPGEYYFSIEEKQPDESYKKIHTTETMNLKKGVILKDILIFKELS